MGQLAMLLTWILFIRLGIIFAMNESKQWIALIFMIFYYSIYSQ